MVGPTTGLTLGIQVAAAKEVSLSIHLLDVELARINPLFHPLVTRIEAPDMSHHTNNTCTLLRCDHLLCIFKTVSHWNFAERVFARLHRQNGLLTVHLRWRRQNDGIDITI